MSSQNLTVIDGSMNVSRRIHSSLQSDGPNIKPNGSFSPNRDEPAFHETRRLGAISSPVVAGMRWRLTNQHPIWDVCNLLAQQDLYHMGEGVYPTDQLPPRPHPNCICYTMDQLRKPKEWQTKKLVSTIKEKPSNFKVDDAKGTDHCIKKQYRIFITLMDRFFGDASSETGVDPQ